MVLRLIPAGFAAALVGARDDDRLIVRPCVRLHAVVTLARPAGHRP